MKALHIPYCVHAAATASSRRVATLTSVADTLEHILNLNRDHRLVLDEEDAAAPRNSNCCPKLSSKRPSTGLG
jgi:hypothetical protein